MIFIILIAVFVAVDQFTKYIVICNIEFGDRISVINNFFYLTHWRNTGAAWGIMQNGRFVLVPVTIVLSVLLAYFIYKNSNKFFRFSLSMILGGALGNLIDRIFRPDGVVDFLDFQFGSYHFPVFNAADTFVVVGTILLAYYTLFVSKE
ncbi:signal peptidase II [Acetivibrio mesophilus]|mgnify:CR=1 FL=1|uniref:Lipoprotein signal peptidase n=1 Tax=Acetivibrio mesophilus TaxID=2487273 RepID=A0A4Q0I5V8_9FIRM|nr:signal peptidase II [Acetivibrio mesophilus]ODM25236.1 signal peptidase II [Clostridium sp. Bc-iso-3]RXE59746.1 signal peptidase II [Acetivibrio mesophilus]HHV29713.1 signal peptidase II [Clostridium sp.]